MGVALAQDSVRGSYRSAFAEFGCGIGHLLPSDNSVVDSFTSKPFLEHSAARVQVPVTGSPDCNRLWL